MPEREKARHAPLVLIANDQEWSARSLESILVPKGYEVVRAYTGRQALEQAALDFESAEKVLAAGTVIEAEL